MLDEGNLGALQGVEGIVDDAAFDSRGVVAERGGCTDGGGRGHRVGGPWGLGTSGADGEQGDRSGKRGTPRSGHVVNTPVVRLSAFGR